MEKITKIYGVDDVDMKVDEGSRTVISIISTDAIDRDGEVVQPQGMKKKNFQGNPVVFTNHDYTKLPVGKALWVKSGQTDDGRNVILAKTYFSDRTPESRDVFGLMQDSILKAMSIGFSSLRASAPSTKEINARPDLKNAKLIHREWELLEYSVVGLPCNQEALTLAVAKGYSGKIIDMLKMPNDRAAAAEVAKAVAGQMVDENKNAVTQKELLKALSKVIEGRYAKVCNPDRVVSMATKAVSKL